MAEEKAIVALSKARSELAEAKTLVKVLSIRDIAVAAVAYAKAARLGLEMQNEAAEIKIIAERKAGEMLRKMPKVKGNERSKKGIDLTMSPNSYEELGIERNQAQRWQKEAVLPEKEFTAYLSRVKECKEEITSKAVYDLAKNYEKNNGRVVWEPKLEKMDKAEGYDNLAFAVVKQAIRDAASSNYGGEPAEWLLDNEYRQLLEDKDIPLSIIDDWVNGGCRTTRIHEVVIEMLNKAWGWSNDE
jgi:hypothetical protein